MILVVYFRPTLKSATDLDFYNGWQVQLPAPSKYVKIVRHNLKVLPLPLPPHAHEIIDSNPYNKSQPTSELGFYVQELYLTHHHKPFGDLSLLAIKHIM
jgi:hypothetical protein